MFPVGKIAQELARGIVVEGLKGEVDLGVQIGDGANVVLKGFEVTCGKCHDREEVVRFENDLVVIIVSVQDNGEGMQERGSAWVLVVPSL